MTAWPASGDRMFALPSDSYFGQVTIVPMMPVWVGSLAPEREFLEIGQASRPVAGSMVPARLFDSGMLNMS